MEKVKQKGQWTQEVIRERSYRKKIKKAKLVQLSVSNFVKRQKNSLKCIFTKEK